MCKETGTPELNVCKAYGVAKLDELPAPNYDAAVKQLNRKLDQRTGGDK
jgi:hypothetical protein